MRFLARDDRTARYLEDRAPISQQVELIRSRHFFHNRGTILQKSIEGLLRSIIYQILNESRMLCEYVRPFFDNLRLASRHGKNLWTHRALRGCLRQLLQQSAISLKLFVLLDALDEYDGEPEYLSKILKDILVSAGSQTHVQILFSSRPWDSFREQFSDVPSICLQEHNEPDIKAYCENTVRDQDSQLCSILHPLIPEIVRRSEGVFVWVKYTLKELIAAGIEEADFETLFALLDSIPGDLREYYTSVIQRIDRKDRLDAYALFQLLSARTTGQNIDSMDVLFAHAVWNCRTYDDARARFNGLMKEWVIDSLKSRHVAGITFHNSTQSHDRFIRPRYLIKRYGNSNVFDKQETMILRLSGGLVSLKENPGPSQSVDLVQAGLDELIRRDIMPRRTAVAMKPLLTKFTATDKEPFIVEPSHQTIYDFIKTPEFKILLLSEDADFMTENRHTWLAKVFLAQNLLSYAGVSCQLAELTTGRSMADFIETISPKTWKSMYYEDTMDMLRSPDTLVDSSLRFAMVYGLTLYLEEVLSRDPDIIRNTKDELILVVPGRHMEIEERYKDEKQQWRFEILTEGEDSLERHLDMTRTILRHGYNAKRAHDGYVMILRIMMAFMTRELIMLRGARLDFWSLRSAEAKAAVMIDSGQDPSLLVSGTRRRLDRASVGGSNVSWRPIHIATLCFTKTLHEKGADLNAEDGHGNTCLDWLLATLDSRQGRRSRGLAHRLIDSAHIGVMRDQWGKIAYLLEHGGIAKTTPSSVWQSFVSTDPSVLLRKQSVKVSRVQTSVSGGASKEPDFAQSIKRGDSLQTASSSSSAPLHGFSDVVARRDGNETIVYDNLGDDGNLLELFFRDLDLAKAYLSTLSQVQDLSSAEVGGGKRRFKWFS